MQYAEYSGKMQKMQKMGFKMLQNAEYAIPILLMQTLLAQMYHTLDSLVMVTPAEALCLGLGQ
jgi:hypothetical protein